MDLQRGKFTPLADYQPMIAEESIEPTTPSSMMVHHALTWTQYDNP
jgi:hypothetical protein